MFPTQSNFYGWQNFNKNLITTRIYGSLGYDTIQVIPYSAQHHLTEPTIMIGCLPHQSIGGSTPLTSLTLSSIQTQHVSKL